MFISVIDTYDNERFINVEHIQVVEANGPGARAWLDGWENPVYLKCSLEELKAKIAQTAKAVEIKTKE
jgi:hypothetical protein